MSCTTPHIKFCLEKLEEATAYAVHAAIATEREACAQVAEDQQHHAIIHDQFGAPWSDGTETMRNIAAAIRARGENK